MLGRCSPIQDSGRVATCPISSGPRTSRPRRAPSGHGVRTVFTLPIMITGAKNQLLNINGPIRLIKVRRESSSSVRARVCFLRRFINKT